MSGYESSNIPEALDELIDLTVEMLGLRWPKGRIKTALRGVLGEDTDHRKLEDVIAAARARLRTLIKTDPDDHRALAISFYETVIRDEASPTREKLSAQDALLSLLGIGAKYNADRGQSINDRAKAIRDAVALMDESMNLND